MTEEGAMADGHDRFEESGSGGAFVIGLLAGTVLGAGLGMLFAPKPGNELRDQISGQAGSLANAASEGYRRASETAGDWVERGRDVYTQTRNVVSRGTDEAQRYMREVKSRVTASGESVQAEAGGGPERG
jgi:gas vesicle protein